MLVISKVKPLVAALCLMCGLSACSDQPEAEKVCSRGFGRRGGNRGHPFRKAQRIVRRGICAGRYLRSGDPTADAGEGENRSGWALGEA